MRPRPGRATRTRSHRRTGTADGHQWTERRLRVPDGRPAGRPAAGRTGPRTAGHPAQRPWSWPTGGRATPPRCGARTCALRPRRGPTASRSSRHRTPANPPGIQARVVRRSTFASCSTRCHHRLPS